MRSFILTAAMAALLASTPFAASAAPRFLSGGFHSIGGSHGFGGPRDFGGFRSMGGTHDFRGFHSMGGSPSTFHRRRDGNGIGPYYGYDGYPGWDSFYNDYYYPGWYPAPYSYSYAPSSRLSVALSDLQIANRRIATDRAHGRLSPAEVRSLRSRDAAIRSEALNSAARDGNRLSASAYRTILRQIGDLDRTIARDAGTA